MGKKDGIYESKKPKPTLTKMLGKRYGRLVCVEEVHSRRGYRIYSMFKCDCGELLSVARGNVMSGHTESCGCLRRERLNKALTTRNNASKQKYWSIYNGMLQRCYNLNAPHYDRYGGRGITVCKRWRDNYYDFESDLGNRPSQHHTIDRIDNDGNYEPGNVRWATRKEQSNNTSKIVAFDVDGTRMNKDQLAAHLGISVSGLYWRISRWGHYEKTHKAG